MKKQIERIEKADKLRTSAQKKAERQFEKIDFRKARRYGKKYLRQFVDDILMPTTNVIVKEAKYEAEH